jgi:hypothetical protein
MKGKALMVRERGQMGPVAQADGYNQGLAGGLSGRPRRRGHTLMRLKLKSLSPRIGSAFGVKLEK